jgi:2,3-bisphosphoglycerate-dependent phosphoglycerate mutase
VVALTTSSSSNSNCCNALSATAVGPAHTLLLCRHGDSIWNGGQPGCKEVFTGWTDVPLSQKGVYEAVNAGQEVASYSYDIDVVFTSVLERAQHTANHILHSFEDDHHRKQGMKTIVDHRLNERHYGALQGYVKQDVEDGIYGHDPEDVKLWRRSWHVVPPLLEDDDPRRVDDIQAFADYCGGPDKVPRGESLEMVAKDRVRPFLDQVMTPMLDQAATAKSKRSGGSTTTTGGTGLVVAHANSLRALIGVICEVENDPEALRILEALRIPTGVPLVLKYQRLSQDRFAVCDLPEADECIIEYFDGAGLAQRPPPDLGHPKLPVWPLNRCVPAQDIYDGSLRLKQFNAEQPAVAAECN